MVTLLLVILIIIAGSAFAGYQIKARGVRLTNRGSDRYEKLFWEVVRVVIRETIRAARAVREIYTVKPENEEEKLHRERYQEYARQRFIRESQERERQRRPYRKGGESPESLAMAIYLAFMFICVIFIGFFSAVILGPGGGLVISVLLGGMVLLTLDWVSK